LRKTSSSVPGRRVGRSTGGESWGLTLPRSSPIKGNPIVHASRKGRTSAARADGAAPRNTTPSGSVTLGVAADAVDAIGGALGRRSSTKRGVALGEVTGAPAAAETAIGDGFKSSFCCQGARRVNAYGAPLLRAIPRAWAVPSSGLHSIGRSASRGENRDRDRREAAGAFTRLHQASGGPVGRALRYWLNLNLYGTFLCLGPGRAGLHSAGSERASAEGGSRGHDSRLRLAWPVPLGIIEGVANGDEGSVAQCLDNHGS
jgi:hypothetical protein